MSYARRALLVSLLSMVSTTAVAQDIVQAGSARQDAAGSQSGQDIDYGMVGRTGYVAIEVRF